MLSYSKARGFEDVFDGGLESDFAVTSSNVDDCDSVWSENGSLLYPCSVVVGNVVTGDIKGDNVLEDLILEAVDPEGTKGVSSKSNDSRRNVFEFGREAFRKWKVKRPLPDFSAGGTSFSVFDVEPELSLAGPDLSSAPDVVASSSTEELAGRNLCQASTSASSPISLYTWSRSIRDWTNVACLVLIRRLRPFTATIA